MLVLSRKIGERIEIGDKIQIVVTKVARGRVNIAIEAPRGISIRRAELDRSLPSIVPLMTVKHNGDSAVLADLSC